MYKHTAHNTQSMGGAKGRVPLGWGGGDGNGVPHIKKPIFDTIAIYSRN